MRKRRSVRVGKFDLGNGRTPFGQLALRGSNTVLRVYGDHFDEWVPKCITGSLTDTVSVTLIDCILLRGHQGHKLDQSYAELEIYPHFTVEGHCLLLPTEKSIRKTTVFINDATSVFWDFDAFGTIRNAESVIYHLDSHGGRPRPIPIGPDPIIAYFGGKHEIIRVDTDVGIFRAEHRPAVGWGGPSGVPIKNRISVSLEHAEPLQFQEALQRMYRVVAFLELLIGREQKPRQVFMRLSDDDPRVLQVHISRNSRRGVGQHGDAERPHPGDTLIEAVRNSDEFTRVIQTWISRDSLFAESRERIHGTLMKARRYSIDRLVAAANAFDILPSVAVPRQVTLSTDVLGARDKAKGLFGALPQSYERDSALSALGRIGKAALKHKARFRADIVHQVSPTRFPRLHDIMNDAINCRNHFVHGTPARVNYLTVPRLLPFLVDTLEFVFVASDLIECGWDMDRYLREPTSGTHPFGSYRVNYGDGLKAVLQ